MRKSDEDDDNNEEQVNLTPCLDRWDENQAQKRNNKKNKRRNLRNWNLNLKKTTKKNKHYGF